MKIILVAFVFWVSTQFANIGWWTLGVANSLDSEFLRGVALYVMGAENDLTSKTLLGFALIFMIVFGFVAMNNLAVRVDKNNAKT